MIKQQESATDTKPKQGATFDIWMKHEHKHKLKQDGWSGWGDWSEWEMTYHRQLTFAEVTARLDRIITNEIEMREHGENGATVYVIVERQREKL